VDSDRAVSRLRTNAKRKESTIMLRIYDVMLEVLRLLRPLIVAIERHDRDLGNQLRRSSASVALNMQEGSGSSGGTRQQRYRTALGSARESGACLDVALALGYLDEVPPQVLNKLDAVRATLAKLVR
jgi:four helix bundle protein